MFELLQENDHLLWWMAVISTITFLLSLLVIPWVILHLPHDYFANDKRTLVHKLEYYSPVLQWLWVISKNLIGLFFLLAGLLMLLIPGQGLLTMFLGLALLNFPGKYRLERWLISRSSTLRWVNQFREKHGRDPLLLHSDSE